ncbi:MAG: arylesterase [Betaproteobacteria bacterium]|nr:arylesterase [Betaproteobacteria bacterium]
MLAGARFRTILLRLVLLALFLAAAGCGDKAPKLPRVGDSGVIVAFGDSLTYGTGATEQESYPAVLAQITGRQVIRAGVPGEMTAQGLRRLPEVIAEFRPDLMIVCLGGNDMLRKVNENETRANLRAIIKTIREQGIAVVLVGVPRPALLASPPEYYGELAREFGIPYESGALKAVLYSTDMKSDAIHPNAKGYRRMAEAVAELLRKAGAI